jgi:hypothetical protein
MIAEKSYILVFFTFNLQTFPEWMLEKILTWRFFVPQLLQQELLAAEADGEMS